MSSNTPQLRFAEFSGEWTLSTLKEVSGKPMYGLNTPSVNYDGENGYIRITDIDDKSRRFIQENITSPLEFNDDYLLNNNDILFARTGASVGKSYKYSEKDGKLYFAGFLIKFPIIKASTSFVFFQTLRSSYDKWVLRMSMRSGQPGINAEEYSGFSFLLPCIDEQQKIGRFLSAVDSKIEGLEQELGLLKRYKQGIMQRLFNQTLRFKDNHGNPFPDWQETKLGTIVKKSKDKNKDNSISVVFSNSATQGIVYQKDYFDNEVANSKNLDGYYVVKPFAFVYNPRISSEARVGALNVNKTNETGLVSPLYTVFTIGKKNVDVMFLEYFFKSTQWHNYMLSIANYGVRDDRMNIKDDDFFEMPMLLPHIDEQKKIADFLSAIDEKIEAKQNQITTARNWKKSLLQKMFV